MNWHGYILIEDLAMTAPQRTTLWAELQALGIAPTSPQPAQRNHWRIRLDGDAILFEALFDDTNFTIANLKARLASIFSVDVGDISHVLNSTTYDTIPTPDVEFSYLATPRVGMWLFGDLSATWEQSRLEVLAFLATNSAAWE